MATAKDRAYAIEARKKGVSYGRIALVCGVSKTTVRRWVDPEYEARARKQTADWIRKHPERQRGYERHRKRTRCTTCRGFMSKNVRGDGVCRKCRMEARDFRRADILRMWNEEGKTAGEIADALQSSTSAIQNEMRRMRMDGWALHHKQRPPGV